MQSFILNEHVHNNKTQQNVLHAAMLYATYTVQTSYIE